MGAAHHRAELAEKLKKKRGAYDVRVLHRIGSIAPSLGTRDPIYLDGLREAVSAGVEYMIETVALGERRVGPPPLKILSQARLAARHGVGAAPLHRGFVAAGHVLRRAVVDEARELDPRAVAELAAVLADLDTVLDRLLAELEDEYELELSSRPKQGQEGRGERIRRLIAGEHIDASELPYEFGLHHVAVVSEGEEALAATRRLAGEIDALQLVDRPDANAVWAWLGTRDEQRALEVARQLRERWPAGIPAGVGEPEPGLDGWRTSHRQAKAVFPRARGAGAALRYVDHVFAVTVEGDEVARAALRKRYLDPLEAAHRETASAYFAAGRNARSAAAALGVSRRTVANRLDVVEERLGGAPAALGADLELALRLEELE